MEVLGNQFWGFLGPLGPLWHNFDQVVQGCAQEAPLRSHGMFLMISDGFWIRYESHLLDFIEFLCVLGVKKSSCIAGLIFEAVSIGNMQ